MNMVLGQIYGNPNMTKLSNIYIAILQVQKSKGQTTQNIKSAKSRQNYQTANNLLQVQKSEGQTTKISRI